MDVKGNYCDKVFTTLQGKFTVPAAEHNILQFAQRGGGCPIPGKIQGQFGQGSEHPDLVENFPAHCKGVRLESL